MADKFSNHHNDSGTEPIKHKEPESPPPVAADAATSRDSSVEKTGDVLRKERIKRRVAIETIARDLKLNARYIKALEEGHGDTLPSPPYIRVYLRSLAKYLLLNPDDILKRYYEENNIPLHEEGMGHENKIEISMKHTAPQRISWPLIALLIAAVATLGFLANHMGLLSSSPALEPSAVAVSDTTDSALSQDSVEPPLPRDSMKADSAASDSKTLIDSSHSATSDKTAPLAQTTDKKAADSASISKSDLRLTLTAIKDSVWVQVFSDGVSWKNNIRANKSRTFTARDSLNVHVGNNAYLRYTLDGKPLSPVKTQGVATFKIDKRGVHVWQLAQWKSVFGSGR
jgi:cytoskeletal protein RodZ